MASPSHDLWVDKYRPRTVNQMCYPVFANKLKDWLINFYDMARSGSFEPKQPRGVLLSGPPGIGKTTTVHVVAAELGITVVEYNASDFRSKKSLHERVSCMTTNRGFASASTIFGTGKDTTDEEEKKCGGKMQTSCVEAQAAGHSWAKEGSIVPMREKQKSCHPPPTAMGYSTMLLLMDEVDGCDIGGVGEIISMLKTTTVPIVSTCNDRWHPKLRSLLLHVEDMRLSRPPCHIVANFLYDRVLAREGISLSKPLLQTIVQQSGSDIRSMLNNLQMWCLNKNRLEQREMVSCAAQSAKTGDSGLFETAEFFLLQGTSRGEIHAIEDMEKAYFNADLIDMFVQENYLHYNPFGTSTTAPSPSFAERQRMGSGRDGDTGHAASPVMTSVSPTTTSTSSSSTISTSSYYALPENAISSWMAAVQVASDAISRGDAAHRIMYMDQNWSVSRAHILLSSILPCAVTRGKYESFCTGQQMFFDRQRPVKFPSWLGQNSSMGKNKRLLRCLTAQVMHPLRGMSGNAEDVLLDYIPLALEPYLTRPLLPSFASASPCLSPFPDTAGASPSPAAPALSPLPTLPVSGGASCAASAPSVVSFSSASPPPEDGGKKRGAGGRGGKKGMTAATPASSSSSPSASRNTEGITAVIRTMAQYHLLRDDWDYVLQVAACFGNHPRPPMRYGDGASKTKKRYDGAEGMWRPTASQIPTATKSAFTRAANKTFGMTQSFVKSALRRVPGGTSVEDDALAVKQEGEETEDESETEGGEEGQQESTRSGPKRARDSSAENTTRGTPASKACTIPGVKIVRSTSTSVGSTTATPRPRASRKKGPVLSPSTAMAVGAEDVEAPAKKKVPRSKSSPSGSALPRSSPAKPTTGSRKRSRKILEEESSESSASGSSSSSEEDSD